jgi:hypothetical protein
MSNSMLDRPSPWDFPPEISAEKRARWNDSERMPWPDSYFLCEDGTEPQSSLGPARVVLHKLHSSGKHGRGEQ